MAEQRTLKKYLSEKARHILKHGKEHIARGHYESLLRSLQSMLALWYAKETKARRGRHTLQKYKIALVLLLLSSSGNSCSHRHTFTHTHTHPHPHPHTLSLSLSHTHTHTQTHTLWPFCLYSTVTNGFSPQIIAHPTIFRQFCILLCKSFLLWTFIASFH